MYLYLGKDTIVKKRDIIGIFDLDNTTVSQITKKYLNMSEKGGKISVVADDIPKSFIVCKKGEHDNVYLSQISVATLKKRYSEFYLD